MYGQAAPSYPQQPHGSAPSPGRAGTLALRIVFASFPVWSLGLLAWVPSLRFAILRKRPVDWAVFAVGLVLTGVYVMLLIKVPADPAQGSEGNLQFAAGLYALLFMTGAVVHAVLADRFPRGARAPAHPPYPYAPGTGRGPGPGPMTGPATGPGYGAPVPGPNPYARTVPATPPPGPPDATPPQPPPPYAPTPPPHAASPRMRQVASELDDLDELLRRRDERGGR